MSKKILVLGGGGFIGHHLASKLLNEGNDVVSLDIPQYDLRLSFDPDYEKPLVGVLQPFDEIYNLAADMGGLGFVQTGEHDADILRNNALINLNVADACRGKRVFFSSSACVYKENPDDSRCPERNAYPAMPDNDYGWEKLFSERVYQAYARNYGTIARIARYHNIFGPEGTYDGGREKAPAALCRKVALAPNGGTIEIWGDGEQTRSFLYIDDCLDASIALMRSDCDIPLNIGSEEMVSLNQLAEMIIDISGKKLSIIHTEGPVGVRGRNSDNTLIEKHLGWKPKISLFEGLEKTYKWVWQQVNQ